MFKVFAAFGLLLASSEVLAQEDVRTPPEPSLPEPEAAAADFEALSLDQLLSLEVSLVSFFDIRSDKATGHPYSFSREMMTTYGVTSLVDLLDTHTPGVNIGYHERTGALIGMRGLMTDNNAKTLLLRDNVNFNLRSHFGQLGADLSSPLLGDVERVEVILGPAAIIHGSGAINGLVNVISPTGASRAGLWARAGFDTALTRQGEVSYGLVSGRSDLFVYAGYAQSDGATPHLPAADLGIFGDRYKDAQNSPYLDQGRVGATIQPNLRAFVRGRTRIGLVDLDTRLTLSRTNSLANALPQSTIDYNNNIDDVYGGVFVESTMASLTPEATVHVGQKTELKIRPTYQLYRVTLPVRGWVRDYTAQHAAEITAATGMAPTIKIEGQGEQHLGTDLILKTEAIANHNAAVGISAGTMLFDGKSSPFGSSWDVPYESPESFSWKQFSAYGEDVWFIGDLTASLGLRYDYTSFGDLKIGDKTTKPESLSSPVARAALAYNAGSQNTIKLSYQEGYRFPDAVYAVWVGHFNEVYKGATPIPAVGPEKSRTVEANYIRTLLDRTLALDFTAYVNQYTKTLSWVDWSVVRQAEYEQKIKGTAVDEGWWGSFGNARNAFYSVGGEAGIRHRPRAAFEQSLWYSYSRPVGDVDPDLALASWNSKNWLNYPTHLLKGSMSYTGKKFRLAGAGVFRTGPNSYGTADMPIHDTAALPPADRLRARAAFKLDAAAEYEILKGLSLSVYAKNLTFSKVEPIGRVNPASSTIARYPIVGTSLEYRY